MCGTIRISCKMDDPCAVRLGCYFHCIKQMPFCVWKCVSVEWILKTLDIANGLQIAKVFRQTSFSPYSPNFLPLYFLKSFHIGFSAGYIQCTFVMFLWNSKHVWLKRKSSLKLLLRVIYKVTLSFYHLINAFDYLKYFMCMDFCILHINENHWIYTHIILLPIWLYYSNVYIFNYK